MFCMHSKALKKIKPPPHLAYLLLLEQILLISNLKIVVEVSSTMSVIVNGFEALVKGFEKPSHFAFSISLSFFISTWFAIPGNEHGFLE